MDMVRTFEDAGAGAVYLEDQPLPKKCGHLNDKKFANAHNMAAQVFAAAGLAETSGHTRTDARASEDLNGASARVKLNVEAGAAAFPDHPRTTF